MNKIILIGYMGCGKSTIAFKLAKRLKISSFDLDELIENEMKLSIVEIFSKKGEIYFRKIEHEIFKNSILNDEDFVISTGGGTPCYSNNHLLLNSEKVISVYLRATVDTLYNRLLEEKKLRPILADKPQNELKKFIAQHLFERSYFYNQATYTVTVDSKKPDEIVSEILSLLI
jgi:shikimate kinase